MNAAAAELRQNGWRPGAGPEGPSMRTISYPEIYARCLDIAYREADARIEGPTLDDALVVAADRLYQRVTGEQIAR